jgi:hypothetical protein
LIPAAAHLGSWPLYRDPYFTFRFAEDRRVDRFHLEAAPPGARVTIYHLDPGTGERTGSSESALVDERSWVQLQTPLLVRAGGGFEVVVEP